MTDKEPTIQEVYAQIKSNPKAYAELMQLSDQDALIAQLVHICHKAGLKNMTTADMTRFLDRDLGEILHELNGDDVLSDAELELVAVGGGNPNYVGKI